MSMLTDVEALLTAGSVSNIYIGSMPGGPNDPDNVVGLYPAGGGDRETVEPYVERPNFEIRVRNTNYTTGEALCNTIKDLLHAYWGGRFLAIFQEGDILPVGRDEANRTIWVINFTTIYQR